MSSADVRLVAASLEAPGGLAEFLREVGEGEGGFGGTKDRDAADHLSEYLYQIVKMPTGIPPQPGLVPMTTFWLLGESDELMGMSRLRHELDEDLLHHGGHIGYYVRQAARGNGYGTLILALTLIEARKLGIDQALITTNSDNIRSIHVIEANGGKLEDERTDAETGKPFRRYWIDLR
jgi:predicted acetyltransferase